MAEKKGQCGFCEVEIDNVNSNICKACTDLLLEIDKYINSNLKGAKKIAAYMTEKIKMIEEVGK